MTFEFIHSVLSRYMYAVGGQDGVSCLNIVERYDSKNNTWNRIAPMSSRRLGKWFDTRGDYQILFVIDRYS